MNTIPFGQNLQRTPPTGAGGPSWADIPGKPVLYDYFGVWAEEKEGLGDPGGPRSYEWSFGDNQQNSGGIGIVLPFECELFAVSLSTSQNTSLFVLVMRNGMRVSAGVVLLDDRKAVTDTFAPVRFTSGDEVSFLTGDRPTSHRPSGGIVSAWFRKPIEQETGG